MCENMTGTGERKKRESCTRDEKDEYKILESGVATGRRMQCPVIVCSNCQP